ncbi:hypothetical protein PZA11_005333 [Diplocarpon coronariae]
MFSRSRDCCLESCRCAENHLHQPDRWPNEALPRRGLHLREVSTPGGPRPGLLRATRPIDHIKKLVDKIPYLLDSLYSQPLSTFGLGLSQSHRKTLSIRHSSSSVGSLSLRPLRKLNKAQVPPPRLLLPEPLEILAPLHRQLARADVEQNLPHAVEHPGARLDVVLDILPPETAVHVHRHALQPALHARDEVAETDDVPVAPRDDRVDVEVDVHRRGHRRGEVVRDLHLAGKLVRVCRVHHLARQPTRRGQSRTGRGRLRGELGGVVLDVVDDVVSVAFLPIVPEVQGPRAGVGGETPDLELELGWEAREEVEGQERLRRGHRGSDWCEFECHSEV